MNITISTLECQTHKGSPIMFVCLDNQCNQKLHCFKCCQQYKKDHNYVKFTDFFLNLDQYISFPQSKADSNQINFNSTSLIEGDQKQHFQDKVSIKQDLQRKSSVQETDNLVIQCVKGTNSDYRKEKVEEECEQVKEELKKMQQQYIDQLFDKQVQEILITIEKLREQIGIQISKYIDQILDVDIVMSKNQDNRVCKQILYLNKQQQNNFDQLNDCLTKLHQGQFHVQFQKEKIQKKINELNIKMDEFFKEVQNNVTSYQNEITQPFSFKKGQSSAVKVISQLIASSQTERSQPHISDFRFPLKKHQNNNKTLQNQISQQSSLLSSMQNSAVAGISQRISFRIKNLAQKKIDNFFSLSPPHSQENQLKNYKQTQGQQSNQSQVMKFQYQDHNKTPNSGSPKNQLMNLFKGIGKTTKQSNMNSHENSRGDEEKEQLKFKTFQKKEGIDISNDEINKDKIEEFYQRKISIQNSNNNSHLQNTRISEQQQNSCNKKSSQKIVIKNEQLQLAQSHNLDTDIKYENQQARNLPVVIHNFNTQTIANNQKTMLKSSPKILTVITKKDGQHFEDNFKLKEETNQYINEVNLEENSKAQERNKDISTGKEFKCRFLFGEHLSKQALLKQTNQLKSVVDTQKQNMNNQHGQQLLDNDSNQQSLSQSQLQQPFVIMSTIFPEEFESINEINQEDLKVESNQAQNNTKQEINNFIKLTPTANEYFNSRKYQVDEQFQRTQQKNSELQIKLSKSVEGH